MFKFRSRANRATEHDWFAWRPVLASQRDENGLTYHWVWLMTVRRKFVQSMKIGIWSHELPQAQ